MHMHLLIFTGRGARVFFCSCTVCEQHTGEKGASSSCWHFWATSEAVHLFCMRATGQFASCLYCTQCLCGCVQIAKCLGCLSYSSLQAYVIGEKGLCDELREMGIKYLGGPGDNDRNWEWAPQQQGAFPKSCALSPSSSNSEDSAYLL